MSRAELDAALHRTDRCRTAAEVPVKHASVLDDDVSYLRLLGPASRGRPCRQAAARQLITVCDAIAHDATAYSAMASKVTIKECSGLEFLPGDMIVELAYNA